VAWVGRRSVDARSRGDEAGNGARRDRDLIVHNHPSGDPAPSQADVKLTRELVEAGRYMKVAVHDHVIVGVQGQSSLRAMGLM
jgi:DNA repair protein RadC